MGEHERAGLAGLCLSLSAVKLWENQRRAWPLPTTIHKRLDRLRETVSNLDAPDFPFMEDNLGGLFEMVRRQRKGCAGGYH